MEHQRVEKKSVEVPRRSSLDVPYQDKRGNPMTAAQRKAAGITSLVYMDEDVAKKSKAPRGN